MLMAVRQHVGTVRIRPCLRRAPNRPKAKTVPPPSPSGANRPGSLLIAVLTCEDYRRRADAVRSTWGRDAKNIVYVIGRPGGPEEVAGDTLYLDCPDSFEGLTQKTFALCRYARAHFDFDRLFKCDDDTFVNVAALEAAHCPADFFGYVLSDTLWPGWRTHKGLRCAGAFRGPWVSGGLGYFLSRRAVSVLAGFRDPEILDKEVFEDKAVSDALRVSGILPARLPGQGSDDFLQDAIAGWAFSAHSVDPGGMADAYARMKASTSERVLTYRRLGDNGRLGNQLWEIASTLGLAAYFRAKVSFNANWASRDVFSVPDDCFVERFGRAACQQSFRLPADQRPWMQDWWNWWAIEPEVREYFRPRPPVIDRLRNAFAAIFAVPESRRLAVHVRRGDYVGDSRHYVSLGPDYYREAIGLFPGMTPLVFSDDPQWCRANIKNALIVPAAAGAEEHLFLMTMCRRHVIANSTFSFWGAMLADSEVVVYPSPWYGPGLSHIDVEWSVLPGWTPLSNMHGSRFELVPIEHALTPTMSTWCPPSPATIASHGARRGEIARLKIALCLIGTGKYHSFLAPCIESVRKHFCAGHSVQIHVCSDREVAGPGVTWWKSPHAPWPAPTIFRYRTMLKAKAELLKADYVFYLDADSLLVGPVGAEICGELTATLHPGFFDKPRSSYTYEDRPDSRACVGQHEGRHYYFGAFEGGRSPRWVAAMEEMALRIDDDASRGITAVWHDESHWNRYLIDHPPEVVLPPTYCCPETWQMKGRKILALDKNHADVRS
jgi:histo-blood group ABO system transferase